MSKRAKQKAFRVLRKQGVDFKTAVKLSSLQAKHGYLSAFEAEKVGFHAKQVVTCGCCGPIGFYLLSLDEKKDVAYYMDYGSFKGITTTREKFHAYKPNYSY